LIKLIDNVLFAQRRFYWAVSKSVSVREAAPVTLTDLFPNASIRTLILLRFLLTLLDDESDKIQYFVIITGVPISTFSKSSSIS